MEGALRARLLGQTAAGSKVSWIARPQGADLPAVTLQPISGDVEQTHDGIQAWQEERVQLDAWAATFAQAKAIRDAAILILAPRHTANGITFDRMGFEGKFAGSERLGTADIYRARVDLIVRHAPA